jgi:hypothetical protein
MVLIGAKVKNYDDLRRLYGTYGIIGIDQGVVQKNTKKGKMENKRKKRKKGVTWKKQKYVNAKRIQIPPQRCNSAKVCGGEVQLSSGGREAEEYDFPKIQLMLFVRVIILLLFCFEALAVLFHILLGTRSYEYSINTKLWVDQISMMYQN